MHDDIEDISYAPDHINDRNGAVSLFILGLVIVLLVLLILAIVQSI